MNHFPFRKDPAPALTRTILRIVNEGSEGDTHGDGATSPPRKTGGATSRRRGKGTPVPVVSAPTTPRVSEPLKISESHSRAALEKMSITQLRALLKAYTAKPGSGRELADIRGLLRAKGAGSVLDEGRKGLGKTQYGKALTKMGAAVDAYNKSPKPVPPVNPFKKAPVKEGCDQCMSGAVDALKKANAADLKEKGGKAGEKAHKRLHSTIARVVGEEVESVDEGLLGRVKKKIQRAGETIRGKYGQHPQQELWRKRHRHEIAAAAERRKREAEERRKREAEERKHPKPKTKARRSDDDDHGFGSSSSSSGDDGGWMGAVGI